MSSTIRPVLEFYDTKMSPLILLAIAVAFVLLSWCFVTVTSLDPREPLELKPRIPFLGHLLGMIWYQVDYFATLSRTTSSPIFTLRILTSRIYILTNPALIQRVFSAPKSFTFSPLGTAAASKLLNMDATAQDRFSKAPDEDTPSYVSSLHDLVYTSLAPGSGLQEMNARALAHFSELLNSIDGMKEVKIPLYRWLRDILTLSAASALYGPDNPFSSNPSLIPSLWDLDTGFVALISLPFPSLFAYRAYRARIVLFSAFRTYFRAEKWKDGCTFVKGRVELGRDYGFTDTQIAEHEVAHIFPVGTNTVPGAFWLLSYALASPELAAEIREEIEGVVTKQNVDGVETVVIDTAKFKTHTPLFVSFYKEMLRVKSAAASARLVTQDTILGNKYLLKANSVIQMPAGVTHSNLEIWGEDVGSLKPRRFLVGSDGSGKLSAEDKEKKKLQGQAYFPFGGGKHLCPGRHFAFTEILGLVGGLLYAFEIERKDGIPFKITESAQQIFGAGIRRPIGDVEVVIRRREGFGGVDLKLVSVGGVEVEKEI